MGRGRSDNATLTPRAGNERKTEVSHAWLTAQQEGEKRNKNGQKAAIMADGATGGRKEKQRWTKVSHAWLTAQQAGEKRNKDGQKAAIMADGATGKRTDKKERKRKKKEEKGTKWINVGF